MERVLVAFGGNVGAVEENLLRALERIARLPKTRLLRVSSLYRTAPVGMTDQPEFLNGAAEVETDLAPEELLDRMAEIEVGLGRTREVRWGPRTVDLDIVLWGDRVIETDRLQVPHPRFPERGFVLAPLVEIAPEARHPVLGVAVRQISEDLGPLLGVSRVESSSWSGGVASLQEGAQ